MQRKAKNLSCTVRERRFTVVRVDGDVFDSHAGRSFEQAFNLANPDRGAKIDVYVTCAKDGGEARLPSSYMRRGQLVRSFRYKGGR